VNGGTFPEELGVAGNTKADGIRETGMSLCDAFAHERFNEVSRADGNGGFVDDDAITIAVHRSANTAGGASTYSAQGGNGNALITNSAVQIKGSAGNLYGYNIYNPNGAVMYVQIFDALAASVTLGTTVPKLSYAIPPNGYLDNALGDESKIGFSTGITIAATTTANGNTAPSTGLTANISFK